MFLGTSRIPLLILMASEFLLKFEFIMLSNLPHSNEKCIMVLAHFILSFFVLQELTSLCQYNMVKNNVKNPLAKAVTNETLTSLSAISFFCDKSLTSFHCCNKQRSSICWMRDACSRSTQALYTAPNADKNLMKSSFTNRGNF